MEDEMRKRFKHLFFLRLIVGLIFLGFGILHFIQPENFRNILRVSNIPLVEFNLFFVPLAEVVIGALLLLGLFTRLAGVMGCITMAIAFFATWTILHLDPSQLPDDLTQKPFSPPLFVPVIVFLICLYLLIMGGGAWSLDRLNKKKQSEGK